MPTYLRTHSKFRLIINKRTNILLIAILAFLMPFQTNAQNRKQLEQKPKKVQDEIQYTRTILKKTNEKKTATLHKIGTMNRIITQQGEVIEGLQTEIVRADSEITKHNATLAELRADYEAQKHKLRKALVHAYKHRKTSGKLAFVLAADNFRQAMRRLHYMKRISDYRNQQIAIIKVKAGKVKEGMSLLEEIKDEKSGLLNTQITEKRQLEADRAEKSKLVNSLAGQEAELRQKIKQNEKAVARLNAAISSMIAQEIAASRNKARQQQNRGSGNTTANSATNKSAGSATATLTPEARVLSNGFAGNRGFLPWPVERGYISQGFGVHPHPDITGITLVNNGVDISTGSGSAVRAVFKGTVSAILDIPGQEKAVLINHGEYFTVYSRLSQVLVSRGQTVDARQVLGTVWTDDDGKTILQFQVWQGQNKLNPAGWLIAR
jgi:septal ring factor EnvC (AmiA/AmiB activator)